MTCHPGLFIFTLTPALQLYPYHLSPSQCRLREFHFTLKLQIVISDGGFLFQPVSLLPTTLQEYEEALPDLPRDKVTWHGWLQRRGISWPCFSGASNIPRGRDGQGGQARPVSRDPHPAHLGGWGRTSPGPRPPEEAELPLPDSRGHLRDSHHRGQLLWCQHRGQRQRIRREQLWHCLRLPGDGQVSTTLTPILNPCVFQLQSCDP